MGRPAVWFGGLERAQVNEEPKPSTLLAGLSFPLEQEWALPRASLLQAFAAVGYPIQTPSAACPSPPLRGQSRTAWPGPSPLQGVYSPSCHPREGGNGPRWACSQVVDTGEE